MEEGSGREGKESEGSWSRTEEREASRSRREWATRLVEVRESLKARRQTGHLGSYGSIFWSLAGGGDADDEDDEESFFLRPLLVPVAGRTEDRSFPPFLGLAFSVG